MIATATRLVRRFWYAAAAAVAIGVLGVVAVTDSSATPPSVTIGDPSTGSLSLDGVDYMFRPETCFVGNDSFVASGVGSMDGEEYRVAASPSVVEITFGVSEESATVPEGNRWLSTVHVIDWKSAGQQVSATVEMVERANPAGRVWAAELSVNCAEVS